MTTPPRPYPKGLPFLGLAAALIASAVSGVGDARAADRVLRGEVIVNGPLAEVWRAWTTADGARGFFAPAAHIEPRVDGAYEVYFRPDAPPGERGSEGMRILALEPQARLSFTWNAPPDNPAVRGQRTVVTVELESIAAARTRVRLTHSGWGSGEAWDRAYAYFDGAWGRIVLPRLVTRFATGPIDWSAPPAPAAGPSLATTLVPRGA